MYIILKILKFYIRIFFLCFKQINLLKYLKNFLLTEEKK